MGNLTQIEQLINELDKKGKFLSPHISKIKDVEIFKGILNKRSIVREKYNSKDGYGLEYEELLTRYLFLNAILDQGPDMEGVKKLLTRVTNKLYKKDIIFLHKPFLFFKNIDIVFKLIQEIHSQVKEEQKKKWAKRQGIKNPNSYNLFLDNSKQMSSYAIGRWGPALSIIQILMNEDEKLLDLFKQQKTAEDLSKFIKSDQKYGLGKAIGNKATHLLVKWLVYSFELIKSRDSKWGQNSYELPFDSNAGRVLFMTGFFPYFFPSLNKISNRKVEKRWVSSGGLKKFTKEKNKKGEETGRYHMYITNSFRNVEIEKRLNKKLEKEVRLFLKENFNPRLRKIKVQHLINYFSHKLNCKIGSIDDGLMKIGTSFCINRGKQKCNKCPLNEYCSGKNNNKRKTKFYT